MKASFTPGSMLRMAFWMLLLFAIAHISGLRVHTSVLSSTLQEGTNWFTGRLLAVLYLITYLLAVFVAPVFAIAGVLRWFWSRVSPD
jgi:hypothetical protein